MYLPNWDEQPQKYHQGWEEWDWNVEESVLHNVGLIRPKPGDYQGLFQMGRWHLSDVIKEARAALRDETKDI